MSSAEEETGVYFFLYLFGLKKINTDHLFQPQSIALEDYKKKFTYIHSRKNNNVDVIQNMHSK